MTDATEPRKRIIVAMSAEMFERIKTEAIYQKRSISKQIEWILERAEQAAR